MTSPDSIEHKLDLNRYVALRQRVGFSQERECTDGFCCFLADNASVTKPRSSQYIMIKGVKYFLLGDNAGFIHVFLRNGTKLGEK